jgi:hypothetical protein
MECECKEVHDKDVSLKAERNVCVVILILAV